MKNGEVFNKKRMERCMALFKVITNDWRRNNSFRYVVNVTEPVEGKTLDDLRKCYFAVGIPDYQVEIPFLDMLVIFKLIGDEHQHFEKMRKTMPLMSETHQARFEVKTVFTDEEAVALLSQMTIRDEKGRQLHIVAEEIPPPDESDQGI